MKISKNGLCLNTCSKKEVLGVETTSSINLLSYYLRTNNYDYVVCDEEQAKEVSSLVTQYGIPLLVTSTNILAYFPYSVAVVKNLPSLRNKEVVPSFVIDLGYFENLIVSGAESELDQFFEIMYTEIEGMFNSINELLEVFDLVRFKEIVHKANATFKTFGISCSVTKESATHKDLVFFDKLLNSLRVQVKSIIFNKI